MKLILLAAAAVIALPAMAQTSGSTGTSTPTSNGGQGTPTDSRNTSTDSTQAMNPAPSPQDTPPAQDTMPAQTTTAPMATTSGTPVGGYQPSTPFTPPPAGATVVYQQAPSPDQAYPAPPPLARYPICKPGQYDQCMQASDAHGSRRAARRRR